MGVSGPREQDRWPSFEAPENVLLLAASGTGAADDACDALLSGGQTPPESVVLVSIGVAPAERLAVLGREGRHRPAEVTVITTEEGEVSSEREGRDGLRMGSDTSVRTTVVSGPGGVTGISHRLAQVISDWDDDTHGRLCFHSITGLLEHAEVPDAFRFLHLVTSHISSVGGIAHFHMDPTDHDEETLGTIDGLFDTVVEYEEGDWTLLHE